MPSEPNASGTPRNKPTTRSSIRQSLNLASVSKAFADVISKDAREASKNAKKTKDASRRLSAANLAKPAAPRTSMTDVRPPSQVSRRETTPESKAVTRRRVSASLQRSSTDAETPTKQSDTSTQGAVPTRPSTLRPRNLNSSSALPKYRPKSIAVEEAKPPSPVRAGTRRRFSSSDDEKKEQMRPQTAVSPAEKVSRPISPLPHRAALKASNTANATPPSTPSKAKLPTPSVGRVSPSRPTKLLKTVAAASASVSSLPRPASSASTTSSHVHHTPKSQIARSPIRMSPSAQGKEAKVRASPLKSSPRDFTRDSPSPLARHSRKPSKTAGPLVIGHMGNMSHISEGNGEDSEEEDVELLLAPVAVIGAPTPAMPRIQRKRIAPQTPTRNNTNLPGRANLSYISPLPPDSDGKSSLRPPQQPGSDKVGRGSILSWEQLASEASKTLGEDELGYLLSDIPAPFCSGAVSPAPSQLDIPESPCLSAIDSPGGYGSISQVLLPDVTPSPAVYHNSLRFSLSPEISTIDSSTATMLRLQLAAAEGIAKERLQQMQAMEEEIHSLKQMRSRQLEETLKQMEYMESQERLGDERATYIASLEDQLQHVRAHKDQVVEEVAVRTREDVRISYETTLQAQRRIFEMAGCAHLAVAGWASVRDVCDIEVNNIRGDRAVLAVLLAELDQMSSTNSW